MQAFASTYFLNGNLYWAADLLCNFWTSAYMHGHVIIDHPKEKAVRLFSILCRMCCLCISPSSCVLYPFSTLLKIVSCHLTFSALFLFHKWRNHFVVWDWTSTEVHSVPHRSTVKLLHLIHLLCHIFFFFFASLSLKYVLNFWPALPLNTHIK